MTRGCIQCIVFSDDSLYLECRTLRQGEIKEPFITRYVVFSQRALLMARAVLFRTGVSYVAFVLRFQTGLTTTVRIHLVKKIGAGGEEDPCLQGSLHGD